MAVYFKRRSDSNCRWSDNRDHLIVTNLSTFDLRPHQLSTTCQLRGFPRVYLDSSILETTRAFLRQHTCANQRFKSLLLCHCESTSILFLMAALQNQLTFKFFDLELLSPSAFVASYGQDVWRPLHWNRLSGNHELFPLNLSKEIN